MNKSNPRDADRRQFAIQWYDGLSPQEKREADRFIASLQGAVVARPQALEILFSLELYAANTKPMSGAQCQS